MSIKSSISFGMVFIPVKLELAVSDKEISFNQLEKSTLSRVRYQKTCDNCGGKVVDNNDIVKAYQYEKDRYVVFNDEDFEKIKTKRDKSITIEQFIDVGQIEPIYYDKAYYVVPTGALKAYALLLSAMEKAGKIAVARAVLGQKERLIALRIDKGSLLMSTLFFAEQVRPIPAVDLKNEKVTAAEKEIADLIIKSMSGDFDITSYADEYSGRVMAAIKAKVEGKEITAPKEEKQQLTDLMEALKQSLKMSQKPAKKRAAK